MRFVGFGLLLILGVADVTVAVADPYVFYQYANSGGSASATNEAFESPKIACDGSVGGSWQGFVRVVTATSWQSSTSTCIFVVNNPTQFVTPNLLTNNGSCPDDTRFDWRLGQCGDFVNDEQQHALLLATFLWLTLGLGLLTGLKAS